MRKLSEEDKADLLNMHVPSSDFTQIQEVASVKYTSYLLYDNNEARGKRISRDEAIRLLGRKVWLSGLARSAFHFSAVRTIEGSEAFVYFNSRRYFADWFSIHEKQGEMEDGEILCLSGKTS
jgi:hypothetical protein